MSAAGASGSVDQGGGLYFGCFFAGTSSTSATGAFPAGALAGRPAFVFFPVLLSKGDLQASTVSIPVAA